MIPIRDTIRLKSFPLVNWLLIGINTGVFLVEINLSPEALNQMFLTWGMTPSRLSQFNFLTNFQPGLTLFTHIFIHSGWFHYLSNMLTLYIFGDNIEDHMGSKRYIVFYLLSGIAAGLSQMLIAPQSPIPAIGASGAIAGVLGAFFLLYPRARITTLVPLLFFFWFVDIPAVVYLGVWFVSQLASGLQILSRASGGVAWWAHIGGFAFGMLFCRLFTPPLNSYHPAEYVEFSDIR